MGKHARGQPYWSHFGVERELEAEASASSALGGTPAMAPTSRAAAGIRWTFLLWSPNLAVNSMKRPAQHLLFWGLHVMQALRSLGKERPDALGRCMGFGPGEFCSPAVSAARTQRVTWGWSL